jgi:hypothetical protein
MNIKSISIIFVGVILIYAGVLSLAEDLYVGVGMMIGGGVLALTPIWRIFLRSRNLSGGATRYAVNTGKQKKTRHLKIVKREEEERPTYH